MGVTPRQHIPVVLGSGKRKELLMPCLPTTLLAIKDDSLDALDGGDHFLLLIYS